MCVFICVISFISVILFDISRPCFSHFSLFAHDCSVSFYCCSDFGCGFILLPYFFCLPSKLDVEPIGNCEIQNYDYATTQQKIFSKSFLHTSDLGQPKYISSINQPFFCWYSMCAIVHRMKQNEKKSQEKQIEKNYDEKNTIALSFMRQTFMIQPIIISTAKIAYFLDHTKTIAR